VTSSWFFLSTLNYDARSTTHQSTVNFPPRWICPKQMRLHADCRSRSVSIPSSRQFSYYPRVWAVSVVCCNQRNYLTVLNFSTSVILQFFPPVFSTSIFVAPKCVDAHTFHYSIRDCIVYVFGQNTEGRGFTVVTEYCNMCILANQNMRFHFIN